MDTRPDNDSEPIDHKTSRSICDAIGERLQQNLRPETVNSSPRLRQLLDEMRRHEPASPR